MLRLEASIISLAFHPSGQFVAIASGASIEVWKWDKGDHAVVSGRDRDSERGGYIGDCKWRNRTVRHMRNIRAVIFHPNGDYLFVAAPDSPKLQHETSTHCKLFAVKFFSLLDSADAAVSQPIELYTQRVILPQVS